MLAIFHAGHRLARARREHSAQWRQRKRDGDQNDKEGVAESHAIGPWTSQSFMHTAT
jgi:hypothetical protein